jgi:peptidoglycan hydrolase-like protein with peptidoglycan-binding domain
MATVSAILLIVASSTFAEEPNAARLEALRATYESAIEASGDEQLSLFRDARDSLDGIIDDYPASDAAVDILLRREISGLDLGVMDRALGAALGDRPTAFAAPAASPAAYVSGDATAASEASARAQAGPIPPQVLGAAAPIAVAPSVGAMASAAPPNLFANTPLQIPPAPPPSPGGQPEQGVDGVAAAAMPPATAAAPPIGMQFAPATEGGEQQLGLSRQDIREVQARLTALGIDPNGIDGVAGRGTRGALRTWQQTSGLPPTGYLDAPQLGHLRSVSQPAYDAWLSDPQNRARVEVVAITPARMAGSWRFTARCGSGSRMPGQTITGILAMEHVGGGAYQGSVRNSQGLVGAFSGRISGRNISTTINWGLFFGRVQMQGQISNDARVVNGRDSNGCRITASKA